jgi:hypothetical protein
MKTPHQDLLNEIVEHNRLGEAPAAVPAKTAAQIDGENGAGRLSTSLLLVTLQQLGAALHNAGEAYAKPGAASPDQLPALLEQIGKQAAGAQLKAQRLLAANR